MSFLIGVFLVIASAFIHYESLWRMNRYLPLIRIRPRRASVLLAVLGAMGSHFIQIAIFAFAFFVLQSLYGPSLAGDMGELGFGEFLYFSAETYTSLGFGDIYPLKLLRPLVGVESITGLVMISWTASFTFFEMQKYWNQPTESAEP